MKLNLPFRILFWAYARMIPHRGISHTPVVGTLTRLIYLGVVGLLVWVVVGRPALPAVSWRFLWVVAGLVISDAIHWVMDI
jgi:uncharacterized metal-binding protein